MRGMDTWIQEDAERRESNACKEGEIIQAGTMTAGGGEKNLPMRDWKYQKWDLNVSYLFQAFHVFEVESNVKKAEIRIYKLKLQEKGGIRCQDERRNTGAKRDLGACYKIQNQTVNAACYLLNRHLQEPFWWWDFSHRHSGVCSFLWKHNTK